MTLTRIFSRGAAGAAAALISSALLVSAAFAQTPPFTIYGSDAGAGATGRPIGSVIDLENRSVFRPDLLMVLLLFCQT